MNETYLRNAVASLPRARIGYIVALAVFVFELAVQLVFYVEAWLDPTTAERMTPLDEWLMQGNLALQVAAWAYWLFCVYRIHAVLARVTGRSYAIGPAMAVVLHFIPLFNIYWSFRWAREVARFVNMQAPAGAQPMDDYAGGLLLVPAWLVSAGSSGVALLVVFGVADYLCRNIRNVLDPRPAPTPPPHVQQTGNHAAGEGPRAEHSSERENTHEWIVLSH